MGEGRAVASYSHKSRHHVETVKEGREMEREGFSRVAPVGQTRKRIAHAHNRFHYKFFGLLNFLTLPPPVNAGRTGSDSDRCSVSKEGVGRPRLAGVVRRFSRLVWVDVV